MEKETTQLILGEDNILYIDGRLTFDNIMKVYKESLIIFNRVNYLIIDLTSVFHVDSAALALLVEWQRFAYQHKKNICFENLPIQLLNLIEVCKIEGVLNISRHR